ncbi:tripartite tricarboxylate transporter permease [Candidatus Woesearchaeota archaeon]|nr:tripartite tricarboxylate transporter permease [Candidatus Woesearchaeota archaeon]
MFEIFSAILAGIALGCVTGLVPGVHVNLVALVLVSLAVKVAGIFSTLSICVIIISTAITHTFLDAIPGIFLGAPDESMAMGALPGHRLLLKGRGYLAVVCTLVGSLGSLVVGILMFYFLAKAIGFLYPHIKDSTGYLLIAIIGYLIVIERSWKKKLLSLLFLCLSGGLGFLVFDLEMNQPLFPLLSGLFGVSLLLSSLKDKTSIVKQTSDSKLSLSNKNLVKALFGCSFTGFIAAFLPGFGSSQAAVLAKEMVGDLGDEGFLVMVGGINTANMLLSIATFLMIGKARNGAIVSVQELIGEIGLHEVLVFLSVTLVVAGLATMLALRATRLFSKLVEKVNYSKLILSIVGLIVVMSLVFDAWLGFVILTVATGLGYVAGRQNVAKSHLLGCLILPVISYFIL